MTNFYNSTFQRKPNAKTLKHTSFKSRTSPLKRSQKPLKRAVGASKSKKLPRPKVWSTATADARFSRYIRNRDPMCRLCLVIPTSDNSHFWGRGHSATRFDPKNCIGICRPCHDSYEHKKNNEYKDWMINWLGIEEYEALERRARSFKKRSEAVAECKTLLTQLEHVL